jgi:hypothetical protein
MKAVQLSRAAPLALFKGEFSYRLKNVAIYAFLSSK